MKIWENGNVRELTAEEIATMEHSAKVAEAEYWASLSYDEAVSIEFRKKYSQDKVEAIINNYLLDQADPLFAKEFQEMQTYRAECKKYVKEKKGMNT